MLYVWDRRYNILTKVHIASDTSLFKVRIRELVSQTKEQRGELKKQILQMMQETPELREVLAEELRRLQQEEEEDRKMLTLEFQHHSVYAVDCGNQSIT